jgi:hypothetical protein
MTLAVKVQRLTFNAQLTLAPAATSRIMYTYILISQQASLLSSLPFVETADAPSQPLFLSAPAVTVNSLRLLSTMFLNCLLYSVASSLILS